MIEKNNVKNDKKTRAELYLDPKTKKFKKGNPGGGRTLGKRNFMTDFKEATKAVAEALKLGKKPDAVQVELVKIGIREALKGNFNFYKDLIDRLYGKPTETYKIEQETKIKKLEEMEEALRKIMGKG